MLGAQSAGRNLKTRMDAQELQGNVPPSGTVLPEASVSVRVLSPSQISSHETKLHPHHTDSWGCLDPRMKRGEFPVLVLQIALWETYSTYCHEFFLTEVMASSFTQ